MEINLFLSVIIAGIALPLFRALGAVKCSESIDPRSHKLISHYNPEPIPDTNLKTFTFYTLTPRRYRGTLTWTNAKKANVEYGTRYLIADTNPSTQYKYQKGGSHYYHHQWFFLPAQGFPGWYHLANRGIPGEFAGWNASSKLERADTAYNVILDPYYSPDQPKLEYLFKIYFQRDPYGNEVRLVPKAFPDSSISCWHETYSGPQKDVFIDLAEQSPGYDFRHFRVTPIQEPDIIQYEAKILKFRFVDKLINQTEQIDNLTNEEIISKLVFQNNGSVTISDNFSVFKDVLEQVYMERPDKFSDFQTVTLERDNKLEIETEFEPDVLKLPILRRQLLLFFRENKQNSGNFTRTKEFTIQQTLEIPQCTEYEITAILKTVKDHPVEYEITYQLQAEQYDQPVLATELRDKLFNNSNNNNNDCQQQQSHESDTEFIDIVDAYTILVKVKGTLWVSYGKESKVIGNGTQIEACAQDFVCPAETDNL